MSDLRTLVSDFVEQLSSAIESDVIGRVRLNVESALGRNGGGHPAAAMRLLNVRKRRKAPIQLCPVPGCANRAAPVFGMVCSDHKDLSKTKIRKYREARKAAKQGDGAARRTKPAGKRRKVRKAKRRSGPAVRRAVKSTRHTEDRGRPMKAPPATAA